MNALGFVLAGIFLICFLITVHELGHFLAAKVFGVKVLQFSVGLGKPVLKRTCGETTYTLGWIPLGGYLRLLDKPVESGNIDHGRSFPEQSKTARMVMILAGPAINLALALALLPVSFMVGTNFPAYQAEPACISAIHPESPLAGGVKAGDCIVGINGQSVDSWGLASLEATVRGVQHLELDRGGQRIEIKPNLPRGRLAAFGVSPEHPVLVGQVRPGSAAAKAGIIVGDRLLAVNEQPVSWRGLPEILGNLGEGESSFLVGRQGETFVANVLPEKHGSRWVVGLAPQQGFTKVKFGFLESVGVGLDRLLAMLYSTLGMTREHFQPQAVSESLGGPLALVQLAGQAASLGFGMYLTIVAFLSLQFALLNLLPIPVFDGGQLILLGYEAAAGRPPSDFGRAVYQRVGIIVVMLLVLVAMWNDLWGLVS